MTAFKSRPQRIAGPLALWHGVFTPRELDAIEAYGDGLMPVRAEIAGRKDDTDHMRITRIAWIERNPDTAWLYARLEEAVLEFNKEFYRYDLYGLVESLQYTVYDGTEGGHYNWHVDHGEHNQEPRKISLSLQLTDPALYEGCNLVMQAGDGPWVAERARGTLVAFPSYVLHRVTPIQSGNRKSLVIWVGGPPFR
jgi:PKHD-type hydroxylase